MHADMSKRSTIDRSLPLNVHDVPLLPMPVPEEILLPNGIKLVIISSPTTHDITRITFSWMGGSYDAFSAPAATIATQCSVTGSRNISPTDFADILDYNGAILGSDLQSHSNTISLLSLNRTLDNTLPAIVDAINHPLVDAREFTTSRERIAAAIAISLEKVTTQADMLNSKMIFGPEHPAAREYTPEQIQNITIEDCTLTLEQLRVGQPPVVYIAGDVTVQVIKTVSKHMSQIDCEPSKQSIFHIIPASGSTISRTWHHEMPHSLQAAIRISIPTVNRLHPDYQLLRLTSMALGGYFGSRLMTSIRELQGLTYGINSGLYGYHEGAFITISAQCDNSYTQRVIDSVMHEIDLLASKLMDDNEFSSLRQTATGSLVTMLDTPFSIADYYITMRHVGTPSNYFALQQEALASLTPTDIMDTAAKYLTSKPLLISTAGHLNNL